jgi:two-component system NtrC family sensor kinase
VGNSGERGTITITTRLADTGVVIMVGDTGSGIPPDIASRVFNPFFTTKPVGRGTGQGLAIAHTIIVERHRGTINFTSGASGGTTFSIQLPVDDPAVAADIVQQAA